MGRSVKAQMKYADKLGVRFSLIIGDTEVESNKAALRDMKTARPRIFIWIPYRQARKNKNA
jgi:histidyl-tRNA synthetase